MAPVALVTGATGFVGQHLVPALLDHGWEVRACGRRPRPDSLPEAVDYRGGVDLAEGTGLDGVLDRVSHLFHLAGASSTFSEEPEMRRVNIDGTENLLDAASDAPLERILYMSTTAVYGEEVELPQPVAEDVEPHPSRGYGKTKWDAEQALWRRVDKGLPALVVRPVSVYGPGAVKLLASAILDTAVERYMGLSELVVHSEPIEQRLVHVSDVVGACLHLMDHDDAVGRAFNIVDPTYPSSHDVADILAEQFGMKKALDDDTDAGPSFEERKEAYDRMRDEGMTDDIVLSEGRLKFMQKSNRNNRVSIDALLGTGYQLQEPDFPDAAARHVAWCRQHRWII
jgi:nucleoside-diphosphate-sugar epimerase